MKDENCEIVLILHDIRSAQNVGAIFRTAEAAGAAKIYLSGYTPAPLDRFGRKRSDIVKTALGAENLVPWESKKNLSVLISKLKREKYFIIALEQDKNSIDYRKVKLRRKKTAILVGNEVTGLSKSILKKCDVVAEIPMRGEKESLNVSVALGIALFQIYQR